MANKGTQLHANNSLQGGDYLTSTPLGTCRLTMEAATGDLVASSPGTWHSGTSGNPSASCTMLANGDLGMYRSDGSKLKHSNTGTNPGAYVGLDDSGNVHLYDSSGAVLLTNFAMHPWNPPAFASVLSGDNSGAELLIGSAAVLFMKLVSRRDTVPREDADGAFPRGRGALVARAKQRGARRASAAK